MSTTHEVSIEEEINQIKMKKPHVVILGAGASKAAFPNGDFQSKNIPLMKDLVDTVGLKKLLDEAKLDYKNKDFETIYSEISSIKEYAKLCQKIETKIYNYFSSLEYPYEPTIYDHLVLSLRETDLIVTFNWDPFLMEAYVRNRNRFKLPHIAFLHGNVTVGYCEKDKKIGRNGNACSKCKEKFTPSPLLFPVTKKDYSSNLLIKNEWKTLSIYLEQAFMITIFGYRAPTSDVEAIKIMKKAWGEVEKRQMEQVEIITSPTANEKEVRATWNDFIHSHHYDIKKNFYDSWIANHPRRTGEAYINQHFYGKFISQNPIPRDFSYMELWLWLKPLRIVEDKHANS